MESSVRKVAADGVFKMMKPLARLLLSAGIGYKEFAEVAKRAFVSVASKDHGLRGRPTNISRVAVMTGLTRKEVRRLRDVLDLAEQTLPLMRSPANMVLSGWYSDKRFLDTAGEPLSLTQNESSEEISFGFLVRAYGGDVPPVALLKELERGGAVSVEEGRVRPLSRFFEPNPMDEEYLSSSFFSVSNLLSTIVHNSISDRAIDGFPERYVFSNTLDPRKSEQFREMIEESSLAYLNSLDDWLVGHELAELSSDGQSNFDDSDKVGVGLYFFKSHR